MLTIHPISALYASSSGPSLILSALALRSRPRPEPGFQLSSETATTSRLPSHDIHESSIFQSEPKWTKALWTSKTGGLVPVRMPHCHGCRAPLEGKFTKVKNEGLVRFVLPSYSSLNCFQAVREHWEGGREGRCAEQHEFSQCPLSQDSLQTAS